MKAQVPWESPVVSMIMSILDCTVVALLPCNLVQKDELEEVDYGDRK